MQKLDIGGVLSRVFNTYRDQAAILLPAALIVFLPFAILNGIIIASGTNFFLTLVTSVLQTIAAFLFTGMVVQLVRDIQDGRRDSSLGELFQSAVPVLGPLILVSILAGLGIGIGFILLVVPGLILLTFWAVVVPVTVLERPGVTAAFGRSRELVRDNGWQVLAVLAIFFIINLVLGLLLSAILVNISAGVIGVIAAQLLTQVIVAPLSALAAPTLYFALRALKEGAGAGAPAPGAPPVPAGGTVPGAGETSAPAPASPAQAPPPPPPPGAPPPSQPPPGAPPPAS